MDYSISKILSKALKIALDLKDIPNAKTIHFSFLVKKNKIISIGWNTYCKTHPIANKFGHRENNIHSELSCIINHKRKSLRNIVMINIRINKRGEIRNAIPCESCKKMLAFYKIDNIIYSTDRGFKCMR